jgi:aminocarboxymuconate-semialdehyde decarboxylase
MASVSIDAHAHLVPESLVEVLRDGTHGIDEIAIEPDGSGGVRWIFGKGADGRPWEIRPFPPVLTDFDDRLRWMDSQHIDIQYVSFWGEMHAYNLTAENGAVWARLVNDHLLSAVADRPRLRAFASLPLGSPEAAAAELRWAAKVGFDGAMCGVHSGKLALADEAFDVLWQAASDTGLILYLHPDFPHWNTRVGGELVGNSMGRSVDTTLALARMVSTGVFHRFPELRIISTHGGGGFPFLWPRLRHGMKLAGSPYYSEEIPLGLSFDIVVHDAKALRFLIEVLGADRLVLGSDYPLPLGDHHPYDTLAAATEDLPDARQAIVGGNLSRLLPAHDD